MKTSSKASELRQMIEQSKRLIQQTRELLDRSRPLKNYEKGSINATRQNKIRSEIKKEMMEQNESIS